MRSAISPSLLVGFVALLGCSSAREAPQGERAEPLGASVAPSSAPPQATKQTPAPTPTPADLEQARQERHQLLAFLLDTRIQRDTMEQTEARLAPFGKVARKSVVPQYRTLESQGAHHKVSIDYSQAQPGWGYFSAELQLAPVEGESFVELYRGLDGSLRERLGKPAWSRQAEGDPLITRGYRVGKKLELTLTEQRAEGRSVVSLMLMEPQGEAD